MFLHTQHKQTHKNTQETQRGTYTHKDQLLQKPHSEASAAHRHTPLHATGLVLPAQSHLVTQSETGTHSSQTHTTVTYTCPTLESQGPPDQCAPVTEVPPTGFVT